MRSTLPVLAALACAACGSLGPAWRAVATDGERTVDLDGMADAMAGVDVVFLGELHDSDTVHLLQLGLTERLLERRGTLAVSLEMFERDAQDQVNLYLSGAIGEARFLGHSRPWKNYDRHYRPVVELARRAGLPVIAANCYRPLATRVANEGLGAVLGDPWGATWVDTRPGPYKEKFAAAMGDHAQDAGSALENFYAAQCLKDDTMAESIARFLERAGPDPPLVVHWCGRFHSDAYLGTVERLLARRPDLQVAVVTSVSTGRVGRALEDGERAAADFVWLVRDGGGG